MSVILDIAGSIFIAAIIVLTINHLSTTMQTTVYEGHVAQVLQGGAISIAEILEDDFTKIGYKTSSHGILAATATAISFQADLMNDGIIDTVEYRAGDSTDAATAALSTNPHDRPLLRIVGGADTVRMNIGMTSLSLEYFDSTGTATASLADIRGIRVSISLQNTEPFDSAYHTIVVDKTIFPRNL